MTIQFYVPRAHTKSNTYVICNETQNRCVYELRLLLLSAVSCNSHHEPVRQYDIKRISHHTVILFVVVVSSTIITVASYIRRRVFFFLSFFIYSLSLFFFFLLLLVYLYCTSFVCSYGVVHKVASQSHSLLFTETPHTT